MVIVGSVKGGVKIETFSYKHLTFIIILAIFAAIAAVVVARFRIKVLEQSCI